MLWGSFRKHCHYQDEKLIRSFLFVCSWLWRLQSIRLPGFPAEVCPVSYCKPTGFSSSVLFLFLSFKCGIKTCCMSPALSVYDFWSFFAGLDPGWASAWRGHSESGSSLPVVQVDTSKHITLHAFAFVDLYWFLIEKYSHCGWLFLCSQGFVSSTGGDVVHAGSWKIRRLWPRKLPG